MKNLKIFENAEFGTLQTFEKDGTVWFLGKEVAAMLGYSNTRDALLRHVEDEDKAGVVFHDGSQNRNMVAVNESGLYSLIISSKLESAKKFKRWVTGEVLPSIRKHGMYATDYLIANPDLAIEAFKALKAERKKALCLSETVAVQKQQISEMKPKASYYDLVLNCKNLISTTVVSKDYGKSAVWLNKKLHEMKVQYKQGSVWVLYQKYAEQGYTSTKTHPITKPDGTIESKPHTYWTQKGRLFIYEQLKTLGILPIIEREEK